MAALEHWKYGDPLLAMIRQEEDQERKKKQAERERLHKGRRIRALVNQVMKGGRR